eukprot:gene30497-35516_t
MNESKDPKENRQQAENKDSRSGLRTNRCNLAVRAAAQFAMDGAFPTERGEPMEGRGGGGRGFRGTAENAKTRLCTRWIEGNCRFGDRCNFAHGDHEMRKGDGDRAYMGGGGAPGGRGRGYGGRGAPGGQGYGGGYGEEQYTPQGYGGGGYGGGYGAAPQGYGGGGYAGGPGGMAAPQGYGGGVPGGMEDAWAAQGCPTPGPAGWYMYRTKETGETYFHNHRTNQTTWERPSEWPASGGPM